MEQETLHGSCLCGTVTYRITGPFRLFQYCHCSRCRKITGSAFSPNIFVKPSNFQWSSGEDQVGRYEVPEAKYYTTSFCKQCGSTLPWSVKTSVNVVVPAGTLDESPAIQPAQNIYWGSRAGWYQHPDTLQYFDHSPHK